VQAVHLHFELWNGFQDGSENCKNPWRTFMLAASVWFRVLAVTGLLSGLAMCVGLVLLCLLIRSGQDPEEY
jgi:hypothetical protein